MEADFWIVLQWWSVLFLMGAAGFPLTKRLFLGWHDEGYFFAKAVGMATVTYLVYLLGILHILPFTVPTVWFAVFIVFALGTVLQMVKHRVWVTSVDLKKQSVSLNFSKLPSISVPWKRLLIEEFFFLAALLFWSWIKAHEPDIRDLEKFMDFGFMKSTLQSMYFPAPDMWYVGLPINYYYFGHTVAAVLTKISGLDLVYTYNLMLTSIFALCLTMAFSIGYQLTVASGKLKAVFSGLLTAFLVTLAGNLQTLYAFTKGYTGEDVKPFWELAWSWKEFFSEKIWEGINIYWYPNATRFIPNSIHEFPAYSFVVSDVHGHVLSIPFVLLAIALILNLFGNKRQEISDKNRATVHSLPLIFYGFLVAVLLMTNALDGPIFAGLFVTVLLLSNIHPPAGGPISNWEQWKEKGKAIGIVAVTALATAVPFLAYFKSFVSGLAVNCPPASLANSKVGLLIFEEVEKCQRSEFWMWLILWGFFLYCGIWLIGRNVKCKMQNAKLNFFKRFVVETELSQSEKVLVVLFFFSLLLIIFPEFFYFKDIYPQHFRSNTMFKLGYQAFIIFGIISGYAIIHLFKVLRSRFKVLFIVFLVPQLFLVSIYPIFAVRSYFNSLNTYWGLNGFAWLERAKPDDAAAIKWMNTNVTQQSYRTPLIQNDLLPQLAKRPFGFSQPIIVEADGDSYTEYERFSVFTGFPTVIGWAVHEWLWRGSYDIVAPPREDVRLIYESEDIEETRRILIKYQVDYVIVGSLEREKFTALQDWKFTQLGTRVFEQGETAIYKVR